MSKRWLVLAAVCVTVAAASAQIGGLRSSEENHTLRTAALRLAVNQTSRVAAQQPGLGFKYFADGGDTSYMFDGSLIIGTSADDLSMSIFSDSTSPNGYSDPAIGRLYSLSDMTFDTLPANQNWGYHHAWGVGCNRDSSIAFDVDFYAPRHRDSANFIIGRFSLYSGPKNPDAVINNVSVCYAVDWDVPDIGNQNTGGFDEPFQMLYQRGVQGVDSSRFGAIAGIRDYWQMMDGGVVMNRTRWTDGPNGPQHDSIWSSIQNVADYSSVSDTGDLQSILVFSKTALIRPKVHNTFDVWIFMMGERQGGSTQSLMTEYLRARNFICSPMIADVTICGEMSNCGDANSDNTYDISDAVFLIAHIFSGGPAPASLWYPKGKGDANGDMAIDISDAVYLIAYIFSGGPPPHCFGG